MAKKKRFPVAKRISPYIPTASMADIAFLLIIFFMLTTSFTIDRTPLELPRAVEREEITDKTAAYIVIDQYGLMKVSSGSEQTQDMSSDEVRAFIYEETTRNPKKTFVLKADRRTPYRFIDEILEYFRQSKAEKIYLLSEAKGKK